MRSGGSSSRAITTVFFTKYVLGGITIGPVPANPDATFQLVERLEADADSPWDWDWSKDADAIVEQLGWKGLERACLYKAPDADPETKAAYKLPVAKLKGGKLTVYRNGVRAAMAVLNGARGGADIPEEARKTIYGKIKKLYKKFGEEAPELRLDNGGNAMSAFKEKVIGIVKRLAGKDPDEAAKREIDELEKSLADEHAKKVDELTATVKGLTERLEKLENPETEPKDDEEGDGFKKLDDSLKQMEERLGKVEARLTKSQQPGEGNDGGGPGGGGGKNMNEFIRKSLGR